MQYIVSVYLWIWHALYRLPASSLQVSEQTQREIQSWGIYSLGWQSLSLSLSHTHAWIASDTAKTIQMAVAFLCGATHVDLSGQKEYRELFDVPNGRHVNFTNKSLKFELLRPPRQAVRLHTSVMVWHLVEAQTKQLDSSESQLCRRLMLLVLVRKACSVWPSYDMILSHTKSCSPLTGAGAGPKAKEMHSLSSWNTLRFWSCRKVTSASIETSKATAKARRALQAHSFKAWDRRVRQFITRWMALERSSNLSEWLAPPTKSWIPSCWLTCINMQNMQQSCVGRVWT